MEIKNSTGFADVVGGSSVFATRSGVVVDGTPGSARAHRGFGRAAAMRPRHGYVGSVSNRPRPLGRFADTRSLRFTGTTLPSRGSTRPEVVALH